MKQKELTLACDLNLVTWPLYEGTVTPKGFDLTFLAIDDVVEIFNRMIRNMEFDISEMSMSSYLMACDRGKPNFTAIPVFPSRVFRHGFIFVNEDSGISEPRDLAGADMGVPSYTMTAALWGRGILQHEYDVAPEEMSWYQAKSQGTGKDDPLAFEMPEDVTLQEISRGSTLSKMLAEGSLDALIYPKVPESYDEESVRRLFPDFRQREEAYFKETGHFPIMHTIVIADDVLDGREWIATELTKSFTEAKNQVFSELEGLSQRKLSIPWVYGLIEQIRAVFGDDFWPYGVRANYSELDAMTQYSYEQGFTSKKLDVENLFAGVSE